MSVRLVVLIALLTTSCAREATGHTPTAPREVPAKPVEPTAPPAPNHELQAVLALPGSASTSLRNANDGTLLGGAALPRVAPGLRFEDKRQSDARYGTVEMVQALLKAARLVHTQLGGELVVHDLSLAGGGPIPRHETHQSGRDVDLLFYQLGPDGQPIPPVGAFFDERGRAVDFHDLAEPGDDVPLRLDVPRTWRLLQALMEDPQAKLQRIFIADHLRALLLRHAEASHADASTLLRFKELACQPSTPHDDHLHLRFFCSTEDIGAGCRDTPPVHGWRRQQLRALNLRPLPPLPRRASAKSVTVSPEEARAAAGPMHAEVERWLERREHWLHTKGSCR